MKELSKKTKTMMLSASFIGTSLTSTFLSVSPEQKLNHE